MNLIANILLIFIFWYILHVVKKKQSSGYLVLGFKLLLTGKLYYTIFAILITQPQIEDLILSSETIRPSMWMVLLTFPSVFLELLGYVMLLIYFVKRHK